MKKRTKLLLTATAVLVSVLCIGFAVSTMIAGVRDAGIIKQSDETDSGLAEEQEECLVFNSLEEYESYLVEESKKTGNRNTSVTYWFPSQLPADATLDSIEVDGESVRYAFSFDREVPEVYVDRDARTVYNEIPAAYGDDALNELLTKAFYKTVKISTITDIDDFAADFAEDLGCELEYSSWIGSLYRGFIYIGSSAGNHRLQLVGQQTVMRANTTTEDGTGQRDDPPPPVSYYYTPVSLSQSEYDNFITLAPHTIPVG